MLQNNIYKLKTLKESNIEDFKKGLIFPINYIDNNKKVEQKEKVDIVISSLYIFLKRDFSERKKDLKTINNFEN